jgi:hypothetical protein
LNITCYFLYCNHQVDTDFLITLYYDSVSVASGIRYADRAFSAPCNIVIRGMPGSTTFFHIISQTARFWGKNLLTIKCAFGCSLQRVYVLYKVLTFSTTSGCSEQPVDVLYKVLMFSTTSGCSLQRLDVLYNVWIFSTTCRCSLQRLDVLFNVWMFSTTFGCSLQRLDVL